ncbi:phage portal protein [Neorickettsia findlayensis]|uniref:Phage portal protein n=2 Tax=Neorickettsia findlayensis TaxID=2686014 RepID=A0A6P1GAR5_9RICK|nr:phage portal protein [Neorickettsia findlayensis]QHD65546.1 phage portal protein [Neorickettsia findlayensis]
MLTKIFKKSRSKACRSSRTQLGGECLYSMYTELWSGRDYSAFAQKAYIRNVIASRAISIVAVAASSVPIQLFECSGTEKKRCSVSHPLNELLNEPNPNMSRVTLIKNAVTYKLISGNLYFLKIGNNLPKELHLLRPDRVTVIPGSDCLPLGYRYKVGNYEREYYMNKITGDCDVLHIKNFHPYNDWYGLSPVEAAMYSIDQHNQASLWNQAMLKNGARPSGAFISRSKDPMPHEQFIRLSRQLENCSGAENAGKAILVEGGIEWKEMSISPKEMDFLQSKYNSAREIALAFGVPPQLLGIPGDNTYSNLIEARLSLWEETVLPILDEIVHSLNVWLAPVFGDNLEFAYEKDSIEALSKKRERLWDCIEKASFLTINEKRQVFGYSTMEGEDEIAERNKNFEQ